MKSIAIIGRGHLGIVAVLTAIGAGYQVRQVVTNKVEPAWDESLSRTVRQFFPTIPVDTSGDWRHLIDLDVDLILSVMYDRIIGPELISAPTRKPRPARILNLHLGKLPEYRGMRPINWALRNGERIAGVTLHEVDEGIDTGPIVAQTTFSIWPERDEVRDVYRRAVRAGEQILRDVLPIIDELPAYYQDNRRARYYTAADMAKLGDRLDWTRATS